jgi:hypothetical protein
MAGAQGSVEELKANQHKLLALLRAALPNLPPMRMAPQNNRENGQQFDHAALDPVTPEEEGCMNQCAVYI